MKYDTEMITSFLLAAEQGDILGRFLYGMNLLLGIGTEPDAFTAVEQFRTAAEHNSAYGRYMLYFCNFNDIGVNDNRKDELISYIKSVINGDREKKKIVLKITNHIRVSAERHYPAGEYVYAMCLVNGIGVTQNRELGLHYIQLSAENGYAPSQFEYAWAIRNIDRSLEAHFLKLSAEQGYTKSQVNYALMLRKGDEQDKEKAVYYLRAAASRGCTVAQYELYVCLLDGIGTPKNVPEAAKYLKMSADSGFVDAQIRFIEYLLDHNDEKQAEHYMRVGSKGDIRIARMYGTRLLTGSGVRKDVPMALHYLKKAADGGEAIAQCNYGYCLLNGIGVRRDCVTALSYIRKSFERGYCEARSLYAVLLIEGTCVTKDENEGARILRILADDENHALAQANYGYCLLNGVGVPKNPELAVTYFECSAAQNCRSGIFNYAICLWSGDGIAKDQERAADYFRELADTYGDAASQYQYGLYLEKTDLTTALKYFEKSAEQGFTLAELKYGSCLKIGRGIAMDAAAGTEFVRRAADKGDSMAMAEYATSLIFGQGIDVNLEAALHCAKQSAEMGNSVGHAMYSVALIKANRIEEALQYMKIAADNGLAGAKDLYGLWRYSGLCSDKHKIDKDVDEGIRYIKEAAEAGYGNSQYRYGALLLNGTYVERDAVAGVHYFELSAAQGNKLGEYGYGTCLLSGRVVNKDVEQGVDYIRKAAEKNEPFAMVVYGCCLRDGVGVAQNYADAIAFFKKSADKQNHYAEANYGMELINNRNLDEGEKYLERSAQGRNTFGMNNYGVFLMNHVHEREADGVDYIRQSAEMGYKVAQNNYGVCLRDGVAVPVNLREAEKWFKKSADQNYAPAQNNLGLILKERGNAYRKDAMLLFKKAAKQGNAEGQYNYGMCLCQSPEEKDQKKGRKYIEKSGDNGHALGQYEYGSMNPNEIPQASLVISDDDTEMLSCIMDLGGQSRCMQMGLCDALSIIEDRK